MPYCTQCGKVLQENEICSCQATAQPVETPQFEQPQAAPQQPYSAPQQPYSAPQQPYAAPQQQYAAPQQPYGAPQQPYGTPQQPYGAPQQPYGAPQQPYYGAPYGAPVKPANTFFNDLLNVIVTFFKKPAEAKTLAIKNGNLLIPGVLLGVYAFFMMIVTWLSVTFSVWNLLKAISSMTYGNLTKMVFSIPGLLFAGLLMAIVFIGVLLLMRFVMGKIVGTDKGDFKSGLVVVSLYSIPSTGLLFLACLCSFFSFGLCITFCALASAFLIVSMICETAKLNAGKLETSKWIFIFPAIVVAALAINYLLGVNILKLGLSSTARSAIDMIKTGLSNPSMFSEILSDLIY